MLAILMNSIVRFSQRGRKAITRFLPALGLLAPLVLTTGCPRNEYVVDLQPQGEKIQRTLQCRRVDSGTPETNLVEFPADELKRLQAAYPRHRFDAASKYHVLDGTFSATLPKDVGGAGEYRHFRTSLGSLSTYLERVRGEEDQQGRLERRMKATDQLADLVSEWLQAELGKEKNFPALKKFLDGPFRKDLKNINLYLWQMELVEKKDTNAPDTMVARAVQYAIEQKYVRSEHVPLLLAGVFEEDADGWLKLLRELLADKLGAPVTQAFLKDPEALDKSWKAFLPKSNCYLDYLQVWEKEHQADADAKKPDPDEAFSKLVEEAADVSLGGSDDQLTVHLSLPVAPLRANGAWDPDKKRVTWETEIEAGTPMRLPVICYAAWVEPDADFQKAHFGKLALAGETLNKYVLWRVNLPAAPGGEWDKFLSGLAPGGNLVQRLESFKFAAGGAAGSDAETAISLIKTGLTAP
jgi:hypothetical protein